MAAYEAYVGGHRPLAQIRLQPRRNEPFARRSSSRRSSTWPRYRLAQVTDRQRRHGSRARDPRPDSARRAALIGANGCTSTGRERCSRATPNVPRQIYKSTLTEFPFDVEAQNASRPVTHDLALRGQGLPLAELKRLLDPGAAERSPAGALSARHTCDLANTTTLVQALDRYLAAQAAATRSDITILGTARTTHRRSGCGRPCHYAHALELEPGFVPARLGTGTDAGPAE